MIENAADERAENNENIAENVEEVFLNEIDKDLEQYFLA